MDQTREELCQVHEEELTDLRTKHDDEIRALQQKFNDDLRDERDKLQQEKERDLERLKEVMGGSINEQQQLQLQMIREQHEHELEAVREELVRTHMEKFTEMTTRLENEQRVRNTETVDVLLAKGISEFHNHAQNVQRGTKVRLRSCKHGG